MVPPIISPYGSRHRRVGAGIDQLQALEAAHGDHTVGVSEKRGRCPWPVIFMGIDHWKW